MNLLIAQQVSTGVSVQNYIFYGASILIAISMSFVMLITFLPKQDSLENFEKFRQEYSGDGQ